MVKGMEVPCWVEVKGEVTAPVWATVTLPLVHAGAVGG